jgi:hypothetical protein
MPEKKLTINISPEKHKELKKIAAEMETTMTDIVLAYIDRIIREYNEGKLPEKSELPK